MPDGRLLRLFHLLIDPGCARPENQIHCYCQLLPAGCFVPFFFEAAFNKRRVVRLRLQRFIGSRQQAQHPADRAAGRRPDGDTGRSPHQPGRCPHCGPSDDPQRRACPGVPAPIGPVLQPGAFRFFAAHRRVACRLVFAIQLYTGSGFQDGLWPGTGRQTEHD